MGITEGEETQKETEEVFEAIVTENIPKLMSDTKPWFWGAQRITSSRVNAKTKTNTKQNLH